MQIPPPVRRGFVWLVGAAVVLPLCLSLSHADDAAATVPYIAIQQITPLHAFGTLTLLQPNQEPRDLPFEKYTVNNAAPGKYTLFIGAPKGTATNVQLFDGDKLLQTLDQPQISFEVNPDSALKITITYHLTLFGSVGVTSVPAGMPFTLTGPDDYKTTGVTPASYQQMPIGVYTATFTPQGCPMPPPKTDKLAENGHVYLSVTLRCDDFVPQESVDSKKITGSSLSFTDVEQSAWYAPSVYNVARLGLITGYNDDRGKPLNMFGPERQVTLAELAKIVHKLVGLNEFDGPDVPQNVNARDKWYSRFIASAESNDWVIYTNEYTDVDRPATRGEILETLLQALDIPLQWPTGHVFTDVTRRTQYAAAIETADAIHLINGKTDESGQLTGTFGPSDPVTRAELSKIISTAADKFRSGGSSSSSSSEKWRRN